MHSANSQSLLEHAVAQQQQPANGQQPQPQPQEQPQPQMQPGNDGNPPDLSAWLAQQTLEGVAKQFGYQNRAEFLADQKARYQREQQNNEVLRARTRIKTPSLSSSWRTLRTQNTAGQRCDRADNKPQRMGMAAGHDGRGAFIRGATRVYRRYPAGNRSRKRIRSRGSRPTPPPKHKACDGQSSSGT